MDVYTDSGNGKANGKKPITITVGAAFAIVGTCLVPGLIAMIRMESSLGHMEKIVDRLVTKVEALSDDVIRLKAWREGMRGKESEFPLAPVR